MKDSIKGNETNDETNLLADTLPDLPVAVEQAEETKGGIGSTVTFTYKVTNPGNVPLSNESVRS